jgi:hypothetical protein
MTNDLKNQAGSGLSGKEDERMRERPDALTSRAKLTRSVRSQEATATVSESGSSEESVGVEDVYNDALLRFGIKI